LAGQHPFIDLMQEYKKYVKLMTAFIVPVNEFIDFDGRIRPNFHNTVAKTGRLSCSRPNLQQLPRREEESAINYRDCFVAPKGKKLIVADFSGQELRMLAEVSKDRRLIDAFKNNYDLHLVTANKLFNLDLGTEALTEGSEKHRESRTQYSEERYKAKNGANFPIIYGSTAWGISRTLGISEEEAQGYIDGFFELYPDVKKKIKETQKIVRSQKWVRNKTGRKRRFEGYVTKRVLRQAFNFLIQGISADHTKAAAVVARELCSYEPKAEAKVILLVHDELVLEVNEDYAEALVPFLKEKMEQAYKIVVPLPVSIKIGQTYGKFD